MSSGIVGFTIGATLAGWKSDRLGRRFTYQFNLQNLAADSFLELSVYEEIILCEDSSINFAGRTHHENC
jgi:hypothetical protein